MMVDIIKFVPSVLPSCRSKIDRIRNQLPCEEISIPIIFSSINHTPQNDRSNIIINTKRWIGRCPGDPPRNVNISDSPYNLHRKVSDRELSRYNTTTTTTTTVDASPSIKIKQQKSSNRESLKTATVTSNSILSNSHFVDALSKHVTIKSEPLRPANNFVNNTVSSWQNYWSSTRVRSRRKTSNDSELILYRPKRDQSCLTATHFVTTRDSSFNIPTEHSSNSSTPSDCTPIKPSSPVIFDQQSSFLKDDQFVLPELVSSVEKTSSSMNLFKSNEDQSLSIIPNENLIINDDNEINTITTKMYKLPLPSSKLKINKPISKKLPRSKSYEKKPILEKKETIAPLPNTALPKRRHQTAYHKSHSSATTIKKQHSLSRIMTTTPRSKYEQKWDEAYINERFYPSTPPPSPSSVIRPQDTNQDENDKPFE